MVHEGRPSGPTRPHRPERLVREYDRIGREREQASREADRETRWDLLRSCAELVAWMIVGLAGAGFALASTDYGTGVIFLYGGVFVSLAGVIWSVASAHRRGQERGDW